MRASHLLFALALALLCVGTVLATTPARAWSVEAQVQADASVGPLTYRTYVPVVRRHAVYLPPGTHPIDRCMRLEVSDNNFRGEVDECVTTVRVQNDGYMEFGFSWTIYLPSSIPRVMQQSDSGNRNMYLTDNLGHRYDHVRVGGAASGGWIYNEVPKEGYFLFPPAARGATTFTFHDDDLHGVITDIVLVP